MSGGLRATSENETIAAFEKRLEVRFPQLLIGLVWFGLVLWERSRPSVAAKKCKHSSGP